MTVPARRATAPREQAAAQGLTAGELKVMFQADRISRMSQAEFADYVRNGRHAEEAARG